MAKYLLTNRGMIGLKLFRSKKLKSSVSWLNQWDNHLRLARQFESYKDIKIQMQSSHSSSTFWSGATWIIVDFCVPSFSLGSIIGISEVWNNMRIRTLFASHPLRIHSLAWPTTQLRFEFFDLIVLITNHIVSCIHKCIGDWPEEVGVRMAVLWIVDENLVGVCRYEGTEQ